MSHRPRRRFGQHFLESEAILEAMAERLAYARSDPVLEIGPGEGALTVHLLAAADSVTVVEIDRDLVAGLRRRFPDLNVIEADVLRLDFAALLRPDLRVVGNLPYNISTPLLLQLLELIGEIRDLHFLLQKEVVDRLAARPGTKDWGRLSILAQYSAHVEPLFDVGPQHFRPAPKVTSTFVRITPRANPLPLRSRGTFSMVLRAAFQQRRKTLRNALQSLGVDWNRVGVDPGIRPDSVDLAGYVDIANLLAEQEKYE
ncbi:MAG: 16S rRNA (adenine(1518)-N(6)/adenine(1519)-N(6))-dimethyltransferase RsmA [Proteobacteria bacterium]|nr:16S rRNA (adenine(1518)-N(6)/adenine(1519)-N(6))-dimethyltransferase RsmA [Pseudomonadota bacterium]